MQFVPVLSSASGEDSATDFLSLSGLGIMPQPLRAYSPPADPSPVAKGDRRGDHKGQERSSRHSSSLQRPSEIAGVTAMLAKGPQARSGSGPACPVDFSKPTKLAAVRILATHLSVYVLVGIARADSGRQASPGPERMDAGGVVRGTGRGRSIAAGRDA